MLFENECLNKLCLGGGAYLVNNDKINMNFVTVKKNSNFNQGGGVYIKENKLVSI